MREDIVNAVVEIPFRSRNKYEIDKKTGKIKLDRVLYSSMGYPAEYGIVLDTLSPDGDPLDILVIATESTYPGCVVPSRVIGYLTMIDNGSEDYKLISVVDCDPRFNEIKELSDISTFTLKEIQNFFENYKKLENIDVKVGSYHNKEEATRLIKKCKERFKNKIQEI